MQTQDFVQLLLNIVWIRNRNRNFLKVGTGKGTAIITFPQPRTFGFWIQTISVFMYPDVPTFLCQNSEIGIFFLTYP